MRLGHDGETINKHMYGMYPISKYIYVYYLIVSRGVLTGVGRRNVDGEGVERTVRRCCNVQYGGAVHICMIKCWCASTVSQFDT